jgi:predicted cupin superfamily sugar epimerase
MTELPDWVRRLELNPHPEGGWFRETWRSEMTLDHSQLPQHYDGPRSAGTAILFVLMPGQESAWHTVRSAEMWLYHRGSPLTLEFGPDRGGAARWILGPDIEAGQHPQVLVPAGHWQRARPHGDEPSLVSCIVVPGFDFADFSLDT